MSLSFEEFEPGATYKSRARTITEADLVNFAGVSGDFLALHMDEEAARKSRFGRRIAHGALVFSISIGLMTQMDLLTDTIVAFYSVDRLRFIKPVFIGDTVHIVKKVAARKPAGAGQGLVTFETRVINQEAVEVMIYFDQQVIRMGEI